MTMGPMREEVMPSRLELCGKAPIAAEMGIPIGYSGERETAGFGNVQTCGLIWACAVCSAKIREERSREIDQGLRNLRERGGDAVMMTLTVPHGERDALAPLIEAVAGSFSGGVLNTAAYRGKFQTVAYPGPHDSCDQVDTHDHGGAQYGALVRQGERQRFGIVGTIRSLEVTYGSNGWHPHLHVLVLTDRVLDDDERDQLRDQWAARWCRAAVRNGLGAPHPVHGVKLTGGWAAYLAKVQDGADLGELPALPGRELARSDSKIGAGKGLVPFQLIEHHRLHNEKWAYRAWNEYVDATRGRQAITWSRGLKAALGVVEVEDQDLAADVGPDTVWVATITAEGWRQLLMWDSHAQLQLLWTLEDGGPIRLWELLRARGVPFVIPAGVPGDWLADGPWDL